jgi:hypothetical protein
MIEVEQQETTPSHAPLSLIMRERSEKQAKAEEKQQAKLADLPVQEEELNGMCV